MDFKDFTAGHDDSGRRLDKVLRIFLSDTALPQIYKLLRKGLIKVNHKKAKPEDRICEGDVISIAAFLFDNHSDNNSSPEAQKTASPVSQKVLPFKIVFENRHLIIIDKPYDRSVHGKEDGLYKDLLAYLESSENKNTSLSFKPGPLHRLDRRTTGLLAFSKSIEGAHWFSKGIKEHTIQKKYYGLVQGELKKAEDWKDKIASAPPENTDGFYTVEENSEGQLAETIARPLAVGQLKDRKVTLVEFAIKTGRKHQIRIQSSLHKHPLVGDTAYGAEVLNGFSREFYLQAYSLNFPSDNPLGLPSEIKIGLSSDFIKLLEYCEIKNPGL